MGEAAEARTDTWGAGGRAQKKPTAPWSTLTHQHIPLESAEDRQAEKAGAYFWDVWTLGADARIISDTAPFSSHLSHWQTCWG